MWKESSKNQKELWPRISTISNNKLNELKFYKNSGFLYISSLSSQKPGKPDKFIAI